MKAIKNISMVALLAGIMAVSSCDPIEDRDSLKNSFDKDDIELEVEQTSNGTGNGVTLKMNTPGVYGYWDYKLGRKYSDEVTFISPFMGDVTFTYHVTTPLIDGGDPSAREYVTKSIQVNVQVADNEVPEAYYKLVGDELDTKTWVFDHANPTWWYMSSGGPKDPPNPLAVWWNAGSDGCCTPVDKFGKMVFDLNGAANYTYFEDADDPNGSTGTFSFNSDFTKLSIGGGLDILGGGGTEGINGCAVSEGAFGEYQIVELTEDRLVLYVPKAGCSSGWTWIFVPEEN